MHGQVIREGVGDASEDGHEEPSSNKRAEKGFGVERWMWHSGSGKAKRSGVSEAAKRVKNIRGVAGAIFV